MSPWNKSLPGGIVFKSVCIFYSQDVHKVSVIAADIPSVSDSTLPAEAVVSGLFINT